MNGGVRSDDCMKEDTNDPSRRGVADRGQRAGGGRRLVRMKREAAQAFGQDFAS
jgi:hypothetical protein